MAHQSLSCGKRFRSTHRIPDCRAGGQHGFPALEWTMRRLLGSIRPDRPCELAVTGDALSGDPLIVGTAQACPVPLGSPRSVDTSVRGRRCAGGANAAASAWFVALVRRRSTTRLFTRRRWWIACVPKPAAAGTMSGIRPRAAQGDLLYRYGARRRHVAPCPLPGVCRVASGSGVYSRPGWLCRLLPAADTCARHSGRRGPEKGDPCSRWRASLAVAWAPGRPMVLPIDRHAAAHISQGRR